MGGVPFFSVVIPTRNRPGLARGAIASVRAQSFRDHELVVLENSDADQMLGPLPEDVQVFQSSRTLPMPANWERAMDIVKGRYVVIISDKDRLIPSALARLGEASKQSDERRAKIITFRKGVCIEGMWTPGLPLDGEVLDRPSQPVLRDWFNKLVYLTDAPMLYNSAVSRELLLSLRHRYGHIFWGASPDVASSVLLLASQPQYRDIKRRLAVSLTGSWGNGASIDRGRQGRALSFVREFESDPFEQEGLVFSVFGAVVETLLACKRNVPDLLDDYQINWRRYVQNTVSALHARQLQGISTWRDWRLLLQGAPRLYSRSDLAAHATFALSGTILNQLRRAVPVDSPIGRTLRGVLTKLGARPPESEAARSLTTEELLTLLEQENQDMDRKLAARLPRDTPPPT